MPPRACTKETCRTMAYPAVRQKRGASSSIPGGVVPCAVYLSRASCPMPPASQDTLCTPALADISRPDPILSPPPEIGRITVMLCSYDIGRQHVKSRTDPSGNPRRLVGMLHYSTNGADRCRGWPQPRRRGRHSAGMGAHARASSPSTVRPIMVTAPVAVSMVAR